MEIRKFFNFIKIFFFKNVVVVILEIEIFFNDFFYEILIVFEIIKSFVFI